MFEDYVEDAYHFAIQAGVIPDDRKQRRLYRAAVFYASSALEAFVNYIADTLHAGATLAEHERAFLLDKKFGLRAGEFQIMDSSEYHRLDDKLRLLLAKFCPAYDVAHEAGWSHLMDLKSLRDEIVHPRGDEEVTPAQYHAHLKRGLNSVLDIMDRLCNGIFRKPLRKKLRELTL